MSARAKRIAPLERGVTAAIILGPLSDPRAQVSLFGAFA
jgi:hypothetical protein